MNVFSSIVKFFEAIVVIVCCCCCVIAVIAAAAAAASFVDVSLMARVYHFSVLAHTALDLATPQESTVASFGHHSLVGLVAASAAHQVAAVHSDGRLVASPTRRAQYSQTGVGLAESWGRLQVHQVLGAWRLQLGVVRLQLEVVPVPAVAPAAAELQRLLVVVVFVRVLVLAAQPPESARVAHHHPGSAVESVLEVVADGTEVRQLHPTCLHRARSRHTVALAFLLHLRLHVLQHKKQTQHEIYTKVHGLLLKRIKQIVTGTWQKGDL